MKERRSKNSRRMLNYIINLNAKILLFKKSMNGEKKLINIKIDKIFISETKRAYETILPLTKIRKDISVEKDKRLNECNFGIFGGLSFGEVGKKYPKIFEA